MYWIRYGCVSNGVEIRLYSSSVRCRVHIRLLSYPWRFRSFVPFICAMLKSWHARNKDLRSSSIPPAQPRACEKFRTVNVVSRKTFQRFIPADRAPTAVHAKRECSKWLSWYVPMLTAQPERRYFTATKRVSSPIAAVFNKMANQVAPEVHGPLLPAVVTHDNRTN